MPDVVTQQLKAYPYTQYADDANIRAFFDAFNIVAQNYLDDINALELPVYLNKTGDLLTWVGQSLYGVPRNPLYLGGPKYSGSINTWLINDGPINGATFTPGGGSYTMSDSDYIRVIQWNTFTGDGRQFSIPWLKKRIYRFLTGILHPDNTFPISADFTSGSSIRVVVDGSYPGFLGASNFTALSAAIISGAIQLPQRFSLSAILTS